MTGEPVEHAPETDLRSGGPLVSVVMPCLDEEEAIGSCIEKIKRTFASAGIDGEIVVCDNGSSDASVTIAERMGARVVHEANRGYGHAYLTGFAAAKGEFLIMGDADDTYDFTLIPEFLGKMTEERFDFVTGSRYLGGGEAHISALHRVFGNPALTRLLNLLFGSHYTDVYCGFRGFSRRAYEQIRPVSPGMEFNLELAINAQLAGLKIVEVPIELGPRKGDSKLRTLRDGWRSLRMMLLYAPNKVFLWPGALLLSVGVLMHIAMLLGWITWGGRPAAAVTGLYATVSSVVGFQILALGLHVKTYSWSRRFDPENRQLGKFYAYFRLETGLAIGAVLFALGAIVMLVLTIQWLRGDMLPLPHPEWASLAATLIILGIGTLFTSLSISAMSMKKSGPVGD